MQCCVPFCKSTAEVVSESTGITFHEFPREVHLRSAWLKALGTQDNLPDSAVVCSQHFLNDDIYETKSGSRQIRSGAIPSTVQVCMICFDIRSKLYPMSKYKLDEAYQHLVGHPLCDLGNVNQTLCVQCAQRLVNFNKFRDKSLRARSLMLELVQKHELITIKHTDIFNEMNTQMKHNIVLTALKPDHCDLYINTDKQTDVLSNVKPVVKSEVSEVSHESMLVDEDVTEHSVVVRNKNTENSLNINLVVTKEEYVSDEELKQTTDPLFVKPSTSKDEDDVPLAQIKYEITFECSVCCEEFADEESYNYHMSAHTEENQNLAEDNAECGQPSVSPSSFVTKSKQNNMNKALYVEISPVETIAPVARKGPLAPLPWRLATTLKTQQEVSTPKLVKPKTENLLFSNSECENSVNNILYQNLGKQAKEENLIGETNFSKIRLNCKFTNCNIKYKKTNTGEKPITCKLRKFKCVRIGKLNKQIHTGEKPFICQICNLKCARKCDLSNHMRIHIGDIPFTCAVCESTFARKNDLRRHLRTHGENPFSCKLCEYKCTRKSELGRHITTHTKSFVCEICNFKVARKSNLANHMKTHTIETPIFSDSDQNDPRNKKLDEHNITTLTVEKPFVCQVCECKFAQKFDLASHMRTHTGDKLIPCDLCEYKCISKSVLERHLRTHTGEKPFACGLCEQKFARKCYLTNHMKIHTGEKPFSCELCNYKCARNGDFVRHMKSHTGESLFTCKLCDYSSVRNSDLLRHMKTHSSKSPFSCELCDGKFARQNHLARHMQLIHNYIT